MDMEAVVTTQTDFLQVAPIEVHFDSGSDWCAASFYRPSGEGPFPVIVMAHGLGGVKAMRLPRFAERFVTAGYACFLFDYRHFGESGGVPRQVIDIQKQLEDWQSAIVYVRTRPDVTPSKVVLWGTSFAGGHVLTIAASIPDVAAVISQCPFTDGLSSGLAMEPLNSLKLTALAICDRVGSWLGLAPVYVPLAAKPGELGLMNSADSYAGYQLQLTPGMDVPNLAAARIVLDIIRYYPGRRARDIKVRVLFCICDADAVAPARATLRHANRAPHKEIKHYPDGHFDIYVGDAFERVISDQIDFLKRTVTVLLHPTLDSLENPHETL
jgi:quorum-quenching protein AidA